MNKNLFSKILFKMLTAFLGIVALLIVLDSMYQLTLLNLEIVRVWWILMFALGMLVISVTYSTIWHRAGLIATILILGISSQLALTRGDWFQSITLISNSKFAIICNIFIFIQLSVTGYMLNKGESSMTVRQFIIKIGTFKLILLTTLVLGFSSSIWTNFYLHNLWTFIQQLAIVSTFILLNIMNTVVLIKNLPEEKLSTITQLVQNSISLKTTVSQKLPFDERFPYFIALWTFAISAILCFFAFQQMPHVEDENPNTSVVKSINLNVPILIINCRTVILDSPLFSI